jgi:hypothetical protein
VPAGQSDDESGSAAAANRQSDSMVQPPSRGLGGAAAHVSRRPHALDHDPGSLYPLGRGNSSSIHLGGELP